MKHILIFSGFLLLAYATTRAQDPDLEADERAALEEIFRTSDQDQQIPTSRRQRDDHAKRVSVPKDAFRIGCVCMDDTHSDVRSIGACSGHGGVRFWVYRCKNGDTVHVMTARHERHPHALTAEEMSELSQKRADRTENLTPAGSLQPNTATPVILMPPDTETGIQWTDAAGLGVTGIAAFFILRLLLGWVSKNEKLIRYALRHLVRHRKRPTTRQNRQNTRKKRLP